MLPPETPNYLAEKKRDLVTKYHASWAESGDTRLASGSKKEATRRGRGLEMKDGLTKNSTKR